MVRQQHGRMTYDVVVLGLGPMGRTMVERYEATGWRIVNKVYHRHA